MYSTAIIGIDIMIDHHCTEEIVCPYCGCIHTDSCEYPDEDMHCECISCGKRFYYSRDVEITYTSHKIKADGSPDYWDELDDK